MVCVRSLLIRTACPTLAYTTLIPIYAAACRCACSWQLLGHVVETLQAAKRAKAEEQREVAKKPMTSWLAGQKLPPVRIIPFRKTNLKMQGWKRWAHLLSRFLPPCGSLCISPKDAQEHFALSAKVCPTSSCRWYMTQRCWVPAVI